MRFNFSLLTFGISTIAFACSGPGVQEGILRSIEIGWIGFGIQAIGAVLANSWRRICRTGPANPLILVGLLAVHPNWWVNPGSGA
jgi:hypothetical protein